MSSDYPFKQNTYVSLRRPPEHYLLSYLNSDSGLTRGSSAGPRVPSVTMSLRQGCCDGKRRSGDRRARSSGFFPAFYFRFSTVLWEERRTTPCRGFITRSLRPFRRRETATVSRHGSYLHYKTVATNTHI